MRSPLFWLPLSFLSACASTAVDPGWVYSPDLAMYFGRDLAGAHPDLGDGGAGHPDLVVVTGRGAGDACGADSECTSGLCKPVMFDKSRVCVVACSSQLPCQSYTNLFCEPQFVG